MTCPKNTSQHVNVKVQVQNVPELWRQRSKLHIYFLLLLDAYNFKTTFSDVVNLKMRSNPDDVTNSIRGKFQEIKDEQAIICHDNLEQLTK